jgi:hypothetical protein
MLCWEEPITRPYEKYYIDGPVYNDLTKTKIAINKCLRELNMKTTVKTNRKYSGLKQRQEAAKQRNQSNGKDLQGELSKCESFLTFYAYGDVMLQNMTSFEVCRRYSKQHFTDNDEFFGNLQNAQQFLEKIGTYNDETKKNHPSVVAISRKIEKLEVLVVLSSQEEYASTIASELDWTKLNNTLRHLTVSDYTSEDKKRQDIARTLQIAANLCTHEFNYDIIEESGFFGQVLLPILLCTDIKIDSQAKDRVRKDPIRPCDYNPPAYSRWAKVNKYQAYFDQRKRAEKRIELKRESEVQFRQDAAKLNLQELRTQFYPLFMHAIRAIHALSSEHRFSKKLMQYDIVSALVSILDHYGYDLIGYLLEEQSKGGQLSVANTIQKLKRRKNRTKMEMRIEQDVLGILTNLASQFKEFSSLIWGAQEKFIEPLVELTMNANQHTTLLYGKLWQFLLVDKTSCGLMNEEEWDRVQMLSLSVARAKTHVLSDWQGVNPFTTMTMPRNVIPVEE